MTKSGTARRAGPKWGSSSFCALGHQKKLGASRGGFSPVDWLSHVGMIATFVGLCSYAALVAVTGVEGAPHLWPCPLRLLTGLPCPFCGITRSLASAMRGDWTASLAYHPLGLVAVATVGALSVACLRGVWLGRPVLLKRRTAWALLVLGALCWIATLSTLLP